MSLVVVLFFLFIFSFMILWLIHITVTSGWTHHDRIRYSEFIKYVEEHPEQALKLEYMDVYVENEHMWGMVMMPIMFAYYTYWFIFKKGKLLRKFNKYVLGKAPWIKE